jgi:hypothetical protein
VVVVQAVALLLIVLTDLLLWEAPEDYTAVVGVVQITTTETKPVARDKSVLFVLSGAQAEVSQVHQLQTYNQI